MYPGHRILAQPGQTKFTAPECCGKYTCRGFTVEPGQDGGCVHTATQPKVVGARALLARSMGGGGGHRRAGPQSWTFGWGCTERSFSLLFTSVLCRGTLPNVHWPITHFCTQIIDEQGVVTQ